LQCNNTVSFINISIHFYNFHVIDYRIMKISTQVKLITKQEEKDSLLQTMKTFNEVCNGISSVAFDAQVFKQFDIHKLLYHAIRDCFPLSAQLCIHAIAKVADSYKKDQDVERKFKSLGAIIYDYQILRFNLKESVISLSTINGRIKIPFQCGKRQLEQLKSQKGESKLVFRDGEFYLLACCEITEQELKIPSKFIGGDRGVNNILVNSLGDFYCGKKVISIRKKYSNLRRKLQKVNTKSAKRKLAKLRGKESRFVKDVNHQVAKSFVNTAQRHVSGLAIEDLKGINRTITVRKGSRYIRHSWSFYDLEQKIIYKAKLKGILVVKVDPRNTSRECSKCGHISKKNRKTQSLFSCTVCGHTEHADLNAAKVISRRADVNRPIVGIVDVVNSCNSLPYKPLPLGRGD
jgi:putative transposase